MLLSPMHGRRLRRTEFFSCRYPRSAASTPVESDFWKCTPSGLEKLLRAAFPDASVEVAGYGNVVAALSAILGLAAWSASTLVEQHALKMYCVLGVVLLGCAIGLSIVRRRRGLPLGFP